MATPVVLTTGARPIIPVESGGVPMTPVDTLGEPVTVVDTLGEPVVLINNDGTPAYLAYSAKTYLGGVAPYHWLDFINNRALYAGADVGNVTQATGYSFTRASDGYYTNSDGTLTLFGSGALRRGDRGVLIEGSRTNLCLQSQTITTTWAVGATTATAAVAAAPDGTTTAGSIVEDGATSQHNIQQTITIASGSTYTATVFCKPLGTGSKRFLRLFFNSGWAALPNAVFDVDLGTVGAVSNATASMTALANGWYRCTVTSSTNSNATSTVLRVGLDATGTNASYAGDGVSGLLVWGAQVELGGFASSYVPTVAASATRAADVLTYTAGVTYPTSLWCEFELPVNALSSQALLQLDAGSINDRQLIYVATSARTIVDAASVTQAFISVTGTVAANTTTKLAGRAATNSVQLARGGTLATEDTLVTQPATPTSLLVGIETTAGGNAAFGYIRRIAVFNSALTDAQLQTVST